MSVELSGGEAYGSSQKALRACGSRQSIAELQHKIETGIFGETNDIAWYPIAVTESITESPSTEAETELLITTTESPVAHESFTATRQDSLSEERLVVTTEITESMTEWSTESVPIESKDEANLSTTESSVTETTPIGEESTESAVFLYFPLQIA